MATLREREAPTTTELMITPVCCHHWIIEAPNGPTSKGVCRICGEEKQFNNFAQKLNPKKISLVQTNHRRARNYAGSFLS